MSTDTPTTPADMRREAAILRWAAERICRHHGDLHGVAISEHLDRWADELDPTPAEPAGCPTCTGTIRETVGLVCQTCGTDYGPPAEALDDDALDAIEARGQAAPAWPRWVDEQVSEAQAGETRAVTRAETGLRLVPGDRGRDRREQR